MSGVLGIVHVCVEIQEYYMCNRYNTIQYNTINNLYGAEYLTNYHSFIIHMFYICSTCLDYILELHT